jgi:tRNA U34 5-methylaminomethyl-2-thiouridine-forming methyltransferase MnmC
MRRKLIVTGDGSHSIEVPELGVSYHSVHGAIQESEHVFIQAGLHASDRSKQSDALSIFEVGFGTGLNALLTLIESEKQTLKVSYEAIEPNPIALEEARMLNYCSVLQREDLQEIFQGLHECEWDTETAISTCFSFRKTRASLSNFETSGVFELIYFDAFDPSVQPELWTQEIFEKMFSMLQPQGILTTYSSKGTVRRAMQAAGFVVEKIPGPPGKREIVRAFKLHC